MARVFAGPQELAGVAASAFGSGRRLAGVERLRGGTNKGVYRLTFDDGTSVIGYVWGDAAALLRPDGGGAAAPQRPCEQVVLDRALDHLAQAAARVERVAAARARLAEVAGELAAAVRPRTDHRLIHGELGPDHVLVDGDGQPVLIDIEGLMFFDLEWEHVFLELRFGEHYRALRPGGLDERRLRFYRLAMHLSLIAGPLRLLDGDFPDREPMMRIVEYNIGRALAFAR